MTPMKLYIDKLTASDAATVTARPDWLTILTQLNAMRAPVYVSAPDKKVTASKIHINRLIRTWRLASFLSTSSLEWHHRRPVSGQRLLCLQRQIISSRLPYNAISASACSGRIGNHTRAVGPVSNAAEADALCSGGSGHMIRSSRSLVSWSRETPMTWHLIFVSSVRQGNIPPYQRAFP